MKIKYFGCRQKMNRAHPNFGLKTKLSEKDWWRKLIRGKKIDMMWIILHKFFSLSHDINLFMIKNAYWLVGKFIKLLSND